MADKTKMLKEEQSLLLDSIDTQIWYLEDAETYGTVNQAFADFVGVDKGEIEHKNLGEARTLRNIDKCIAENKRVFQQKERIELEEWLENSDGEKRLLLITKIPRLSSDNEVEYVVCSAVDVTELKKMEKKLRLTEFSIENAAVAVFWISPGGEFQYVNKTACEKLNYSREELIGKRVSDVDSDFDMNDRDEYWRQLKEMKVNEIETRHRTSGGEIFPVQVTSVYLKYDEREYEFAFAQDISKRKSKEKRLKEQKYRLEKLHDVAYQLKKQTSEEKICQLTLKTAENLFDFEFCIVRLVEDDLLIARAYTEKVNKPIKPRPIEEKSISAKTFREGKSIIVDNIEKNRETDRIKDTFKSGISVPIGEHGVFQAIATEESAFDREDLKLAELLVAHTAATLDKIYAREKIKYNSFHDELTGLYNRRFFEEEKKRLDTKRQLPISLIMVDVNGLKIINDSLGHKKGDELLRKTAEILQGVLREEDIIARYGGDEFVILLPRTGNAAARKISSRIQQNCEKTGEDKLPVSLGVGIATKNELEDKIDDVLTRADNNMLQNKLINSRSTKNKIIESLLNVLGEKSAETKDHTRRLIEIARKLGEKVGLPPAELDKLSLLAHLHDIGKTSIPEEILTKSGDLEDDEWEKIKRHPQSGYKIALASEEFAVVARDVLAHHEHWDGGGYPQGLKGEEIPYLARILSIVDAYDVMISGRPYQEAVSREEALAEIIRCAGSQFDPELAKKFVEMMEA